MILHGEKLEDTTICKYALYESPGGIFAVPKSQDETIVNASKTFDDDDKTMMMFFDINGHKVDTYIQVGP